MTDQHQPEGASYPDPRYIRDALDWGQQRLADEVGVARETISRWENGAAVVSPMGRRALARVWAQHGRDARVVGGV